MNGKMFDIAWEHAGKIKKQDFVHYPVCKMDDGTWFGNVYAMMKVEPFEDCEGIEIDYKWLEREFPFLKEKSNKVDMEKWFDPNEPEKIEGNEIEFTELIIQRETGLGIAIGRVYKYKNKLGLMDPKYDYLGYNLDNSLDYIAKDINSPIIGIKKGEGTIRQRAVIAIMPLRPEQKHIIEAVGRAKEEIEKIQEWPEGI